MEEPPYLKASKLLVEQFTTIQVTFAVNIEFRCRKLLKLREYVLADEDSIDVLWWSKPILSSLGGQLTG